MEKYCDICDNPSIETVSRLNFSVCGVCNSIFDNDTKLSKYVNSTDKTQDRIVAQHKLLKYARQLQIFVAFNAPDSIIANALILLNKSAHIDEKIANEICKIQSANMTKLSRIANHICTKCAVPIDKDDSDICSLCTLKEAHEDDQFNAKMKEEYGIDFDELFEDEEEDDYKE